MYSLHRAIFLEYAIQLIHGSSASHGQITMMLRDDDVTCCGRSNDGPAKRRHCCDGDHCAFLCFLCQVELAPTSSFQHGDVGVVVGSSESSLAFLMHRPPVFFLPDTDRSGQHNILITDHGVGVSILASCQRAASLFFFLRWGRQICQCISVLRPYVSF